MSATNTPTLGPEQAAVRKVMYRLAELDGTDADDMDLLTAANEALENVEDLQRRVTELEAKVESIDDRAPDPSRMDYDSMDKADKATVVRSKLKAEAEATNGAAAATYKDVIRMFDGHPSAGHAYDLMRAAGERDGCEYDTAPDGSKRLTYNAKRDATVSRRE
mgnify:CR=1 FL=1